MSSPAYHLPAPLSEAVINELLLSTGLPEALSISRSKVTAQYHSIYHIKLPERGKGQDGLVLHTDLILRVSGLHLPKIKTANEVAVMLWVAQNTSIPIPAVIAYDDSTANPLGHEYTLLSREPGEPLSAVYTSLGSQQLENVLSQLIDMLVQLEQHDWSSIGGLERNEQGVIIVTRVVDESFWQTADIEKFWPPGHTLASLNLQGPYPTYVELIIAQIQKYIELINIHPSLSFLRPKIPRFDAFLEALADQAPKLNKTKLRLAHKDLHFANMLYDTKSGLLTAILDWEFAGVVPKQKWDPSRAFLWNGRHDEGSAKEKNRMLSLFARLCKEREVTVLADAAYTSSLQESMQIATDFLRAITEVAPRGQRQDLIPKWVAEVEANLSKFGV